MVTSCWPLLLLRIISEKKFKNKKKRKEYLQIFGNSPSKYFFSKSTGQPKKYKGKGGVQKFEYIEEDRNFDYFLSTFLR